MPRYALFAFTICFLTLIPIIRAVPTFDKVDCNATDATIPTYAQNSIYQTNLNTLLSALSSNSTVSRGFYKSATGTIQPDVAYGFFLCRGDVSAAVCEDCVGFASRDVVAKCPTLKRVTIWYDECMLRYSNRTISFNLAEETAFYSWNGVNVTNVTRFNEAFTEVMDDIANRASSDNSEKKFATKEASYSPLESVYGLAQCTPDLSNAQCKACLQKCRLMLSNCCNAKQGARILSESCNVRYNNTLFYDASFGAAPRGNGGIKSQVIIAIVVAVGVAIMLFIASFCFLTRRVKKKDNSNIENKRKRKKIFKNYP